VFAVHVAKNARLGKDLTRRGFAFVTRSQPLEASKENAYVYGESASGARYLNTPRMIADTSQNTVWRWDLGEPFGNDMPNDNPAGVGAFDFPLRLPGQWNDNTERFVGLEILRANDLLRFRAPRARESAIKNSCPCAQVCAFPVALMLKTRKRPLLLED